MAKKASDSSKTGAATKAKAKKAPVKKAKPAVKKASSETAAKSGTPKAAASKKAAPKKAAPAKKSLKLNDRQRELLKKVKDAGEAGYAVGVKTEQRTIDAMHEKKLLKRGAKSKDTGKHSYTVTKAGDKHLTPSGSHS